MKIKHTIRNLALAGSLLVVIQINAQEQLNEKRAQIEALRQEYIAERLALNEKEQAAFDEVQAEFKTKMKELRNSHEESARQMKKEMHDRRGAESELSEAEAREILMNRLDREEAEIKLEKEYTEAMIEAISAKKTVDYKRLEREFKRELIHMLKDDKSKHRMREELRRKHQREADAEPMDD